MDWPLGRQKRIENKLAKKHLANGTLVLFDVSSSFYAGRKSKLVQHGYSRDHRPNRPQIVYGLLCDPAGRPIAIEVFSGNTADPKAFTQFVQHVRKRFGIKTFVFVGDRGMITSARIDEDLRDVEGFEWISALRSDALKKLVKAGHVDRSLFDESDLAEITDDENFPRRTSGRVPQPDPRGRAIPQTKRTAGRDGSRAGQDRQGHSANKPPAEGSGQDRFACRPSHQQTKDGQALRTDDHRHQFFVQASRRTDRSGSINGRLVRGACERTKGVDEFGRIGSNIQKPEPRRASVPKLEDGGPSHPPDLPLGRRPHPCPRVSVHAGVLRGGTCASACKRCCSTTTIASRQSHLASRSCRRLRDRSRQGRRTRAAERRPIGQCKASSPCCWTYRH